MYRKRLHAIATNTSYLTQQLGVHLVNIHRSLALLAACVCSRLSTHDSVTCADAAEASTDNSKVTRHASLSTQTKHTVIYMPDTCNVTCM